MRRRELMLAVAATTLVGCADAEVAVQSEAATQRRATPAEVGSSYDISLALRLGSDLSDDNAGVFSLELEAGQTVAVVMRRRDDSGLRAYLAAYGPDERKDDRLHGQRELMMAQPDDGLLILTAHQTGTHLVVVADRDLAVDAEAQVDFITLDNPAGFVLRTYDPGADAYVDELRRLEPELSRFFDGGTVWETGQGQLDYDETDVPIKDRARLRGLVPHANETREGLFAALAEDDPELAAEACGQLWRALRSDAHRLRRL